MEQTEFQHESGRETMTNVFEADAKLKHAARELSEALDAIKLDRESRYRPGGYRTVWRAAIHLSEMLADTGNRSPLVQDAAVQEAAIELLQHPVFIGGVHKSGTTLLRNLMDSHPKLLVIPTDGFGYGMLQRLCRTTEMERARKKVLTAFLVASAVAHPYSKDPNWLLSGEPGDVQPYLQFARYFCYWTSRFDDDAFGLLATIVCAFLSLQGQESARQKRYWVEKSTFNMSMVDSLLGKFPSARFVHIVRHPAAIICSQKRKQILKGRRLDLIQELETIYSGMALALENRDKLGVERYHVIKYEDLVAETDLTMKALTDLLQIEFDEILTTPTVNGHLSEANTAHSKLHFQSGTVSKASSVYWRQDLTEDEVALIQCYMSPLLDRLGYEGTDGGFAAYLRSAHRLSNQYGADPHIKRIGPIQGLSSWLRRARV